MLALFGIHHESLRHVCLCGSTISGSHWLFGVGNDVLMFGAHGGSESNSAFYEDFLTDGHIHTWPVRDGTRRSVWGKRPVYGFAPEAGVALLYHNDPAFRAWLRAQVASGVVTREMIRAAVDLRPPESCDFGWTPP